MKIAAGNTILYCSHWEETLAFYRDVLQLEANFANDWFVEFRLAGNCFLSVANAARSSIPPGGGRGLTLSLRVPDLHAAHRDLSARYADIGPIKRHGWGAEVFYLRDPEGNRIEFWSDQGGLSR